MAEYVFESKPAIIEQSRSTILRVAVVGAVVGVGTWMLAYMLQRFVISALFCSGESVCDKSIVYSGAIALIIVSVMGVVALVRSSVYRPLLIALGAVISLWGISGWISGLTILEQVGWMALLFALAYSAYGWLARIRNVPIMLISVVILMIATRFIPAII
ncbi:hypothetical protein GX865_01665 [Candidatus Saccharibacteria bacterium]|jgi:hypothetical protein|nr:hypothetical protein [Candidatus Saccharibacteria bacterium]